MNNFLLKVQNYSHVLIMLGDRIIIIANYNNTSLNFSIILYIFYIKISIYMIKKNKYISWTTNINI